MLPKDGYFYAYGAASAGNIVQNTTQALSFAVDGSAAFDVVKLSYQIPATTAQTSSNAPVANMNVTITDTDSNEQWFGQALSLATVFGSGQIPFILPRPRRLQPRTVVTLSVTNLGPDAPLAVTFSGLRLRGL